MFFFLTRKTEKQNKTDKCAVIFCNNVLVCCSHRPRGLNADREAGRQAR